MIKLEFECGECKQKIKIDCTKEEEDYYIYHGRMDENSELYQIFFNGHGWTLQPGIYCNICKYNFED